MCAVKVCIDPGHAPNNPNKGQNGYYEYAGMWKLSNYLKDILLRCGIEAYLTRTEYEDPTLVERCKRAKGSDLFISEHSNAGINTVRGVECFYSIHRPNDRVWANKLSQAVSNVMNNNNRGAKIRESSTPGYDYYGVIRYAVSINVPHVFLIENGFHSNLQDEKFLLVDSNLKKIAEAQAVVICELFGVKYVEKGDGDMTNIPKWKKDIIEKAMKEGLITSEHNPDEKADKWFVLQVQLNLLDKIKKMTLS